MLSTYYYGKLIFLFHFRFSSVRVALLKKSFLLITSHIIVNVDIHHVVYWMLLVNHHQLMNLLQNVSELTVLHVHHFHHVLPVDPVLNAQSVILFYSKMVYKKRSKLISLIQQLTFPLMMTLLDQHILQLN